MPKPTKDSWKQIPNDYVQRWQFLDCVESIGGKHVLLQAPAHSGSWFYNYKNRYCIVLLAVVDARYNFVCVDVGAYDKQSDGSISSNSQFGKMLLDHTLRLPNLALFVFVGDEAFLLRHNLMRPFPGSGLPLDHQVFNY